MKKIVALLLAVLSIGLYAGEEDAPTPADEYTIFQLGFFLDQPSSIVKSNVYGVKAGFPVTNGLGRVYGVEGSWFYSGTAYIKGVQGSWILNQNKTLEGLQASFVGNINDEWAKGLQAAFVLNIAGDFTGLQAGEVSVAED